MCGAKENSFGSCILYILSSRVSNRVSFCFHLRGTNQLGNRVKKKSHILVPEGTPLYKLYRYVSPDRVGFLCRFGLKTGMHFGHFGLESGMVFEGTTGVYERIYRFNSK